MCMEERCKAKKKQIEDPSQVLQLKRMFVEGGVWRKEREPFMWRVESTTRPDIANHPHKTMVCSASAGVSQIQPYASVFNNNITLM